MKPKYFRGIHNRMLYKIICDKVFYFRGHWNPSQPNTWHQSYATSMHDLHMPGIFTPMQTHKVYHA